jgi:vacuolar-type H+-ATPase subunit H
MLAVAKGYGKAKKAIKKGSKKLDEAESKAKKVYKQQVKPMIKQGEQHFQKAQDVFESKVKPGLQKAQANVQQAQQYREKGKQMLKQLQPQLDQMRGDPRFQQMKQGVKQMAMEQIQPQFGPRMQQFSHGVQQAAYRNLPAPLQQMHQFATGGPFPQQQGNWLPPPPFQNQYMPSPQQQAPTGWIYVGTGGPQQYNPSSTSGGNEDSQHHNLKLQKPGLWWIEMK